jgi:hypothetical protein
LLRDDKSIVVVPPASIIFKSVPVRLADVRSSFVGELSSKAARVI